MRPTTTHVPVFQPSQPPRLVQHKTNEQDMDIWVHKLKSYKKFQLPRTHIITHMLVTIIEKQLTIFLKVTKTNIAYFKE
jgi:hypothetical protein